MVAYSERQRVRRLLAEAITMLCKSSLSYKFGFSVEGLIGITLDDSQVILVNINEEVTDKSWRETTDTKISSSPRDDPIDLRVSLDLHGSDTKQCYASGSANSSLQKYTPGSDVPEGTKCICGLASCGKRDCTRSRLSNGHGSKKRRLLEFTSNTHIKVDEDDSQDNPAAVKNRDGSSRDVTPVTPDTAYGPQDVIFIKDEEEDSDTSADGDTGINRDEHSDPHSLLPPGRVCTSGTTASDIPTRAIKVENQEAPSPQKRGSSPIEVTYEAGMWATESANERIGSSRPHPDSHQVPLSESSATSPLATSISHSGNNEQDVVGQQNSQVEMDHTEWPSDPQRRPRASYSTAYKLMVVRRAIESGNMRATARKFGIHFKQVWQWTRNKEKLLAMSLSALRSPRLYSQNESASAESEIKEKAVSKPPHSKESSPD